MINIFNTVPNESFPSESLEKNRIATSQQLRDDDEIIRNSDEKRRYYERYYICYFRTA